MNIMGQPVVSDLVDALAATIRRMHPGDRLPSEHQIMTRHGVTRATARAAVQELEDLFLVRRVQGTGTFVNRRIDYPISQAQAPSFHRTVEAAGATARTVLIGRGTAAVAPDLARQLEIPECTETLRLERLGYIDGLPACFFQEWFNPRAVPDLDVALRVFESVAEVFEAGGFHPVRTSSRGTVDIAPPTVCARLELPRNRQTWLVESTNTDRTTGMPLMLSRAWTRLDQVRMIFKTVAG
jgi:DNA-binding GntR family transcriptional regulator